MWYALLLLREDFKENCKENDIVQKGGVSEKSNYEFSIKNDILLGEGG